MNDHWSAVQEKRTNQDTNCQRPPHQFWPSQHPLSPAVTEPSPTISGRVAARPRKFSSHPVPQSDRFEDALTSKGDAPVAKYITFFSYSADAVKAMIHHPSDRSAAATELVEALGGTVEAFFWMQGQHDGFLITELPDSVSGTALVAAVASTGAVSNLESHEIFDHDQQAAIVTTAKTALDAYTPPN